MKVHCVGMPKNASVSDLQKVLNGKDLSVEFTGHPYNPMDSVRHSRLMKKKIAEQEAKRKAELEQLEALQAQLQDIKDKQDTLDDYIKFVNADPKSAISPQIPVGSVVHIKKELKMDAKGRAIIGKQIKRGGGNVTAPAAVIAQLTAGPVNTTPASVQTDQTAPKANATTTLTTAAPTVTVRLRRVRRRCK